MPSKRPLRLLITVLTIAQVYSFVTIPTNHNGFHGRSRKLSVSLNTAIDKFGVTQYPPTTTVSATLLATKGVRAIWRRYSYTPTPGLNIFQSISTGIESGGRASIPPFPTPSLTQPIVLSGAPSTNASAASAANNTSPAISNNVTHTISNYTRSAVTALRTPSTGSGTFHVLGRQATMRNMGSTDIFRLVATGALPEQVTSQGDHPVVKLGIVGLRKVPFRK